MTFEPFDGYQDMQSTIVSTSAEEEHDKRSLMAKCCSPVKRGSIRMSIITMLAPCMGIGMLGLPCKILLLISDRAAQSGIILEVLIMMLAGTISCLSMHILSWAAQDLQCNSYNELIQLSLGNRAKRVFEIMVICGTTLGLVNIQISFQLIIYQICVYLGFNYSQSSTMMTTQLIFIIPNLLISWQKSLYRLRYISLIGVCSILYLTLLIFMDFVLYGSTPEEIHSEIKYFTVDMNIFVSFAMTFYCFICHLFVFPIKKELHNPTLARQSKVWVRTTVCSFTVYLVILISGYLNFLDSTQIWIINNYKGNWSFFGKLGMSVSLFFAVPFAILACRNVINDMLLSDEVEYQLKAQTMKVSNYEGRIVFEVDSVDAYRNKIHKYSTLGLQLVSGTLALFIPEIPRFVALIGGFTGTFSVCVFPLLVYLKEYSDRRNYLIIGLEVTAIIFGWTGAIYSQF